MRVFSTLVEGSRVVGCWFRNLRGLGFGLWLGVRGSLLAA